MDVELIFKIASIGLAVAVLNMLLEKANKKEIGTITSMAGLIIALYLIVQMISQLINEVKDVFYLR